MLGLSEVKSKFSKLNSRPVQ